MSVSALLSLLSETVGNAFAAAGFPRESGKVVPSARPDLAQFQCNGALACAKQAKKNPLEVAEHIASALQSQSQIFARVEVAKPGFLNFDLTNDFLSAHLQKMSQDRYFGGYRAEKPQKVIIDYCGPNVAKPMHVGHLRSSVIGNSLYRLFKQAGHEVVSDIHLGDWGLPMGMLISEIEARGLKEPVTLAELETMYPQAAAACKAEESRAEKARLAVQQLQDGKPEYRALWEHFVAVSVSKVKENLHRLDIDFDLWLGESDTDARIAPLVEELKSSGKAELSEGAWVIQVEEPTDKSPVPPLLLVKSDGAALYSTTDLATIQQRVEEHNPDLILYVVDQRQHLHFEQVFRAARKVGLAGKAQMEHIGFGTVNGKDGKPFKTREGGVMKLEDLIEMCVQEAGGIEEIGIAALKFADLSSQRISGYMFDVEKFVSTEGRTGPYLQYACVRVHSIMHKSEIKPGAIFVEAAEEKALALISARFPDAMQQAITEREPCVLADYAYSLAQAFSRFYTACPILKAENEALIACRIGLSRLVHGQIALCLYMLGIHVPDKM